MRTVPGCNVATKEHKMYSHTNDNKGKIYQSRKQLEGLVVFVGLFAICAEVLIGLHRLQVPNCLDCF